MNCETKTVFDENGRIVIRWVGEKYNSPDTYLPGFCKLTVNELSQLSTALSDENFKNDMLQLLKMYEFVEKLGGK